MAFNPAKSQLHKLGQFARNLRRLAEVPSRASRASSEALRDLIRAQFVNEVDPYGNAWEPLAESTIARKYGDDRILRRSDRMFNGLRVTPISGGGIRIELAPYGAFHQTGSKNMPARPILPMGTFPKTWSDALKRAARGEVRRVMRGAA
jgi:hypothetical protein